MKYSIKIYIVEDEFLHSKYVKNKIMSYFGLSPYFDAEIIELANFKSLYTNLEEFPFMSTDLFILDIHLNTFFTGIDFAKKIRKYSDHSSIIFLTNDELKSIESINSGTYPLGYLVKSHMENLIANQQFSTLLKNYELLLLKEFGDENIISLKSSTGDVFVNSNDILYISTAIGFQKKTIVKTSYQEFLCNERIIDIKKKLPQGIFFKELRSYIINVSKIEHYDSYTQTLIFENDISLFLGPKQIKKVKLYLKNIKS